MPRRARRPPAFRGAAADEARRDVRSVRGQPTATTRARSRRVAFRGFGDEVSEFVRAPCQIVQIEHPFGQAAEEAGHAVLEDLAARAQNRGPGRKLPCERDQVVLVAAGAVKRDSVIGDSPEAEASKTCSKCGIGLLGCSIPDVSLGRTCSICERCDSRRRQHEAILKVRAHLVDGEARPSVAISRARRPAHLK